MGQSVAITFGEETVLAEGLSSGSGAYSLGVLREAKGYRIRISREASFIPDDDRDGRVDLFSGRRVPLHSLWIVVDPTTGASAVASPDPRAVSVRTERLNMGQLRKVVREGEYATFLWVRPGGGAWTITVEDSGLYDDSREPDGKLGVELERMTPVDDSPSAPRTLQRGDVIFAVNPARLDVVEIRSE